MTFLKRLAEVALIGAALLLAVLWFYQRANPPPPKPGLVELTPAKPPPSPVPTPPAQGGIWFTPMTTTMSTMFPQYDCDTNNCKHFP